MPWCVLDGEKAAKSSWKDLEQPELQKQGLKRGRGGAKCWCGAISDSGTVIIEAKNAASLPQVGKNSSGRKLEGEKNGARDE